MNYRAWILENLLDRYEKSGQFLGKDSPRKIAFRVEKEEELECRLERAEEKEQFLEALTRLRQEGLIDFSWVRYETGNLVDRIWLNTDGEILKQSYKALGRVAKGDKIEDLKTRLKFWLGKIRKDEGEIRPFLERLLEQTENKRRYPRYFTEISQRDDDILECLAFLAENQQEIQERVLSSRLYGDSKYFEREIKSKVLSVLRAIKKIAEEEFSEEDLLREKGLVKWPEIMEFTGPVKVWTDRDKCMDFGVQTDGAYINSLTIEKIRRVELEGIRRVLLIENKANYVWYVAEKRQEDELVLFHGGCYSPVKGKWFRQVYGAGLQSQSQVEFYHWSDIDVGGFRIFNRLKTEIMPALKPYCMDTATLTMYAERGIRFGDSYKKLLQDMETDARYLEFWELIGEMLRLELRLEQEQEL